MRAHRIKINLNPDREADRRVLDYLHYSGVSNSKAIITAVCAYLDRQDAGEGSRFLQEVKETIRESVQGLQLAPSSGALNAATTEDEDVSPLDFLDALESGATFEDM